ncbi:hypothetical protein BP00DRAFT_252211 [Aspergillus indologenus CBS 114.80]|uniref:Uncharacterized protein n=1 Tax=Aspergillus indologenus CBS 114.80 TaxID=1450541 RepID=A0A2V5IF36_9EURO|nr:hypothetical protein BP00DRAFT_252211 [Aspergillus indologenus CBS 114.80]
MHYCILYPIPFLSVPCAFPFSARTALIFPPNRVLPSVTRLILSTFPLPTSRLFLAFNSLLLVSCFPQVFGHTLSD